MIKTVLAAGTLALAVVAGGTAIASAEEAQVEGNYSTLAACQADGPNVQVNRDNNSWTTWDCRQGNDGLFYLFLSR
ncbi:hypothetical protein AB0N05_22980 [Nocardia sp. NPDC051030]|uniref:hypothetical protein n=1 Tax=Nocardia sp. NPDC051030 TaxID=3155162 RepID=UPI003421C500